MTDFEAEIVLVLRISSTTFNRLYVPWRQWRLIFQYAHHKGLCIYRVLSCRNWVLTSNAIHKVLALQKRTTLLGWNVNVTLCKLHSNSGIPLIGYKIPSSNFIWPQFSLVAVLTFNLSSLQLNLFNFSENMVTPNFTTLTEKLIEVPEKVKCDFLTFPWRSGRRKWEHGAEESRYRFATYHRRISLHTSTTSLGLLLFFAATAETSAND